MMNGMNSQILLCSSSSPYPLGSPPPRFSEFRLDFCRKTIFLSPLSHPSVSHSSGCSSQNMHASIFYRYVIYTRWQKVFSLTSNLTLTLTSRLLINLRLESARTNSFSFSMGNYNLYRNEYYVLLQLIYILMASLCFLEFPEPLRFYSLFIFHYYLEIEAPSDTIRLLYRPKRKYQQGNCRTPNEAGARGLGTIWWRHTLWRGDESVFSELIRNHKVSIHHYGTKHFRVLNLGERSLRVDGGRQERRPFCRKWFWFRIMSTFDVTIGPLCKLGRG